MIKIDRRLLDQTTTQAKAAPRRRINHNFHASYSDPLQRMLNAIEPGSYIRPHKHDDPDKREIFFVLRGRLAVIELDEAGNITDHVILDPATGNYGVEIPARVFHFIMALDEGTVAYEVKPGPFCAIGDKNFAPWAPPEGDDQAEPFCRDMLKRMMIDID